MMLDLFLLVMLIVVIGVFFVYHDDIHNPPGDEDDK